MPDTTPDHATRTELLAAAYFDQAGVRRPVADLPAWPPQVGDMVRYVNRDGEALSSYWEARTRQDYLVVGIRADEDGWDIRADEDGWPTMYDPASTIDFWTAAPASLTVTRRAVYVPVRPALPASWPAGGIRGVFDRDGDPWVFTAGGWRYRGHEERTPTHPRVTWETLHTAHGPLVAMTDDEVDAL